MNSSISIFRIFRPLIAAVACVILIEVVCAVLLPADLTLLQSPLLHMAYRKPIRGERINTVVKIELAQRLPGNIIQIGESTGLAGIQPNIVNTMLPDDLKILNLSTQYPAEFQGFNATEEIGLRTHTKAFYAMAVISPLHLGAKMEGFGNEIEADYIKFPFWKLFSSLKARAAVLNLFYYQTLAAHIIYTNANPDVNLALTGYIYDMLSDYQNTGGWLSITLHNDFVPHKCAADHDSSVANSRLQAMYDIAQSHGARLIIVLAPIRCTPSELTDQVAHDVEQFIASHPGTITPLPLIYPVQPDWLGDEVHLTPDGSAQYSKILGEAMKQMFLKTSSHH